MARIIVLMVVVIGGLVGFIAGILCARDIHVVEAQRTKPWLLERDVQAEKKFAEENRVARIYSVMLTQWNDKVYWTAIVIGWPTKNQIFMSYEVHNQKEWFEIDTQHPQRPFYRPSWNAEANQLGL